MFDAIRNVMDAVPFPVFVLSEDGIYLYQNPVAADHIGYRDDEIAGLHLTDLLEAEPKWVLEGFEKTKSTGHFSGPVLYRMRRGGLFRGDANVFLQTLSNGCKVVVSMVMPATHGGGQSQILPTTNSFGLSGPEIRLIQLLSAGLSESQIAEVVNISTEDLRVAIDVALAKMGVASKTEVVIVALRSKIVL
jgi:PAS domain S-box-containing protein